VNEVRDASPAIHAELSLRNRTPDAGPAVSVVVPARRVTRDLLACLAALEGQSLSRERFEIIVSLDRDRSRGHERIPQTSGVKVVRGPGSGAAAARNHGLMAAEARWVAFTDSDCLPARSWLAALLHAVEGHLPPDERVLGATGQVVGYKSDTPAARFVDLTAGLDARRHLSHPRYPWAPTGNVVYAREALLAVRGFDARFVTYEGCDLHTRLRRRVGGAFLIEPRAVVFHRHRSGWRRYWRQQEAYGRGYAQFVRAYSDEIPWPISRELRTWLRVIGQLPGALAPAPSDDALLVRRGTLIKEMAQRIGFATTYWSPRERLRWSVTPYHAAPGGELGTSGGRHLDTDGGA
jgi:glycosyltransferase involved in cell wall biosynthesis